MFNFIYIFVYFKYISLFIEKEVDREIDTEIVTDRLANDDPLRDHPVKIRLKTTGKICLKLKWNEKIRHNPKMLYRSCLLKQNRKFLYFII